MENQKTLSGVYLVAGLRFHPQFSDFLVALEQAFTGGIRLFQLRTKNELPDWRLLELAKKVRQLTRKYNVTFLINDRPDIAMLCEADGLHLGPADMSVSNARKIVGNMIIGKSSHNIDQAREALTEEIDYLSVGPVFETDCKPVPDSVVGLDLLKMAVKQSTVPVVAIGGITAETAPTVRQAGAASIGVIRDIMAADDISAAATRMIQAFNQTKVG